MANVVRAAIVQTEWTGDKDSMIKKHEDYARQAAEQGAQVMCFQEIFYGPYFCQVQENEHFDYAEAIPDGPTVKAMQDLAKETGMVLVVPMFEKEQDGFYYNTAAVIDADGSYLGKYRKTHIPHVKGFWEKFYFRPGNTGYPIFDTAVGTDRRLHLLRPPLPRGLASAGAERAPRSSSTPPPPAAASRCISGISSSRRRPSPTSTSSEPSTGWARNPSGTTTSTVRRTSSIPGARSSAAPPPTPKKNWWCATSISTWSKRFARPGPSTGTAGPTPTETWSPPRAPASDPTQMGVGEAVLQLEPVAERPVHADVG